MGPTLYTGVPVLQDFWLHIVQEETGKFQIRSQRNAKRLHLRSAQASMEMATSELRVTSSVSWITKQ